MFSAHAHAPAAPEPPTLATAWTLSPWLLVPLIAAVLLYVVGLARLWRRAGAGRGIRLPALSAGTLGLLALLAATVWPLDAFGAWSLGAHMAQHMLLLALVPPLLLAAKPVAIAANALPVGVSRALHTAFAVPAARLADALAPAAIAHSAVMWLWHLPRATAAALHSEPLHWAMHASFLLAGLWFWAALWRRLRDPDAGAGSGVVALVAVMMQMGFLGALLTFAPRPLYPVYLDRAPAVGLDPLVDQQLAGLVMWVPSCLPYLVGALWLLWRGFERLERRSSPQHRRRLTAPRLRGRQPDRDPERSGH